MPYVYILKCSDGTYYTGYTTCMERRIEEHQHGTASKYTRGRRPVECVYIEEVNSKSEALRREIAIKNMKRLDKEGLINEYRSVRFQIHNNSDDGKNNTNKSAKED